MACCPAEPDAAAASPGRSELARRGDAAAGRQRRSCACRSAGDRFAEACRWSGRASLTVEEIVARHQAAAARQAASVQTLIATGTLTLSFEAPGFPAPVGDQFRT